MICKYCGAQYTGNTCPACGKVIPLVKRSTDLDVLMSGTPAPAPSAAPAPKTYEQGIREGYQKGLKEGYDNGCRESKSPAVSAAVPAAAPSHRKITLKTILLSAAVVVVAAAAGGLIGNRIGYNAGYKGGSSDGQAEGIRIAESTYKPQIDSWAEKYQEDVEQARREGYETAKKELAASAVTPTPAPVEIPSAITPVPAASDFDFPYSSKYTAREDPVVAQIQNRLLALGYSDVGEIDGKFGANTETAVKQFNADHGLGNTGIVDEKTFYLLFKDMEMDLFCNLFQIDEEKYRSLFPPAEPAANESASEESANASETQGTEPETAAGRPDMITEWYTTLFPFLNAESLQVPSETEQPIGFSSDQV